MSISNKKINILKVFIIFIVIFQLFTPLTIGRGIKNNLEVKESKISAADYDWFYFVTTYENGAKSFKKVLFPFTTNTPNAEEQCKDSRKESAKLDIGQQKLEKEGDRTTDSFCGKVLTGKQITGDPSITPNTITPTEKQTDTKYTLLAPLPGIPDFESDPDKNPCAFGKYMNIMIKIILGIAAVLAMIMIIKGGFEYMASSLPSGKESGKGTITQAILGLLIALGAYLILFTINPNLLNFCLDEQLPKVSITIMDEEETYESTKYVEIDMAIPTGPINNCNEGIKEFKVGSKQFYMCGSISNNVKNLISDTLTKNSILLGGKGYRSTETQIALRKANCNGNTTDREAFCKPLTALPGTSRHEAGLAFDFTCDGYFINVDKNPSTKKCFDWLKANAKNYGLSSLLSEDWHWSTDGR
ncbi:MAG: D-alanyl-D-alanine carboxypeptidase family protein [Patescibacteria group bacterium]